MHSDFNSFNQEADIQGMKDAEFRYSGAMLPEQIAERYSQLCQVDYSKHSPAKVPADAAGAVDFPLIGRAVVILGGLSAVGYVVVNTAIAVVAAVHAFCAANAMLIGGGAVVSAALLLFFAGKGGGGETEAKSGNHYHYYENNHYYDQRSFNKK